jgi:hypothetical protein
VRPGLTVADLTRHGSIGRWAPAPRGVRDPERGPARARRTAEPGASGVCLTQVGDANTVQVGDRLAGRGGGAERAMRELEGFNLRVGWSQGDRPSKTGIATLFETLMYGGLLALVVLLLFLKSWRLSLVIALSIPLAMTLTLAVMYFYGRDHQPAGADGLHGGGRHAAGQQHRGGRERLSTPQPWANRAEASAVRGAGEIGLALDAGDLDHGDCVRDGGVRGSVDEGDRVS